MNKLAKFYTSDIFSQLLVSQFNNTSPVKVVDLGVGGGSLIRAAISRWSTASYFATDVDRRSISKIKRELPFVNSFQIDTLREEISDKLALLNGDVDIAVCNPPFLKLKNNISYNELFEEANLIGCKKLITVTSDIIFLAKNIQLLKPGGELGIILPDSLITGKDFFNLRQSILKSHSVKAIIQLPEKIYAKTEALTHILLIEKNKQTATKSPILLADNQGQIVDKIEVPTESLLDRMDFKYHLWKKKAPANKKPKSLRDIKVDVRRGSLTHKELKDKFVHYVHSTHIVHGKNNQSFCNNLYKNPKQFLTQKGDILLTRVGRNSKVCMISKGRVPISDCVYCIRVPTEYQSIVWKSLNSDYGKKWLEANAHGVCAKVISKNDLLNFPLV